MADDTPEVAAAKRAADIAKARLDEARSLSDLTALRITGSTAAPSPVTPLTGETKLTDVTIESRILAQKAIVAIGKEIAKRIVDNIAKEKQTIVFYDAAAFGAIYQYRATMLATGELIAQYDSAPAKAQPQDFAIAPITLAMGAASAVAGFLALFRTNTEIVGKAFTPAEAVLVATLIQALQTSKPDWAIVYPALNLPVRDPKQSPLLVALGELLDLRQKPVPDTQVQRLAALNDRVDHFVAALGASDDFQKSSLPAMLKAERLATILDSDNVHVLAASLHDVTGGSKTTRNLFTRTHLYFSGGAVATFFLLAAGGSIQTADTLYYGTGFVEMTDESKAKLSNLNPT